MQICQLNKIDIESVQATVQEKLALYHKENDVIGAQIFNILENESRVLYYPLEDQEVWGFSETIKEEAFVCINTSIPYDKQVFAAAHELYHVWSNQIGEVILSHNLEDVSDNKEEMKASRFAAEFLVNEKLLRQEMKTYAISIETITEKEIVQLAGLFLVPYKTMVRRFLELGFISNENYQKFMALTGDDVEILRKRLSFSLPVRENKIGLNTLVDCAMDLYEKNLITVEKLEYELSFANLTLEDMGIAIEEKFEVTDELLESIMEEADEE